MYDMEIDKIQNVKMTLETQVINLESAVLNKATVGAMSEGTKAMKSIRIKCGIEKVDEVIDAVREDGDFLTDMTSALSQSTYTVLVDDDELLAELNELTGADTAPTKYNAPAAKPLRGYGKVAPNASRLLVPAS